MHKLLSPDGFKDPETLVSIETLIGKLRKLIENFEVMDEEKED